MKELTGIKLVLAIVGLVLTGGSSLTAAAFELKNGTVSRFISGFGTKQNIPISIPEESKNQTPVVTQETSNQATTESNTNKTTTVVKKSANESLSVSGNNESSLSGSEPSSSSSSGTSSGTSNNPEQSSGGTGLSNNSGTNLSNSGNSSDSGASSSTPSNIFGNFSATSIESIVGALNLVFDDATGDYTEPGGGGPPEGVFDYAPIDQDNIYMGVRGGRLYIKWTLGGTLPTSQQTENGNKILSVVYNIGVDSDNDLNDSCGGAETHLQINIAYHDDGQIWYNPWYNANCLSSGETEHDSVYEKTGNGLAYTYNSGIGKDSITWSYALDDLASTISVGSNLRLDISSEAEGSVYHHYSYDQNRNEWIDWTVKEI